MEIQGNRSLPSQAATVVVGAGPAGAVMAARLAEAGEDVLLLEAGPDYGPPAAGAGRSGCSIRR